MQGILITYVLSGYTFQWIYFSVFAQGMKFWIFFVFSQGQGIKSRVAHPPSILGYGAPPGISALDVEGQI